MMGPVIATANDAPSTILLRVLRQDRQGAESYWEEFEIPYRPQLNVISTLMEVRKRPVNAQGKFVRPPAWEAACLEEVCGSCTMNINGRVRQACTALIDDVGERKGSQMVVELEAMRKFPLVRDLIVDRSSMFESLKKIKGWVPIDGSYDLGMAQPQDDHIRQLRYSLSRCMTCGCCLEACPQVSERSKFVGPAAIGQTLLFNLHPVGKALESERLEFMESEAGITNCGNAQNCVKVCPKGVPLTHAIADLNREATRHSLGKWFRSGPHG
ncbi:MAG: succinate dehydrogenase [Armatimonadetes bacterium OLB18]|nr:MAG: succinate dehydrogenase [Armatimonadetes bacterium OLB18]